MSVNPYATPKVLTLYLELSQYPILARYIRQRMREEMFARGIIASHIFEAEVRDKAIASQRREGIINPMEEEPMETWETRLAVIRDHLTDFYFAYNLHHDQFKGIVQEVLSERQPNHEVILSFNPELAPWDVLFSEGLAYESLPPEQRTQVQHHLREIIVVLIKAMISDQLSFVRVAREYFSIQDLEWIRDHRIGRGKIGGKAAGMLLASRILQRHATEHGIESDRITIPESWYLASDVYYRFHHSNDMYPYMNQKYKRPEQMREDYPAARAKFLNSRLPQDVELELWELMEQIGDQPLIVRSSSLLEDSFDTSFAGKYDSFFLPNQATLEENFKELTRAIILIYASVIRPEALIYREQVGLTDYDERMAILIQKVAGRRNGSYFFPDFAGVGFSHNPYRWSPRIDADQGLLRLVMGIGTRAVDRVGADYPRMVAVSHPTLRPESSPGEIRRYSQRFVDVLDLDANEFREVPISEIFTPAFGGLGAIASEFKEGMLTSLDRRPLNLDPDSLVVTFDRLLHDMDFMHLMRTTLDVLEQAYKRPVDIEFAGEVLSAYPQPQVTLSILQCRPLSQRKTGADCKMPDTITEDDVLFDGIELIPQGCAENITTVVYVDPRRYAAIENPLTRADLGGVVSRLNQALEAEPFILMGPGRWGSSNIHLGVRVNYGDIFNTKVLIELAMEENGTTPEVSYGTHFFQDLVEAGIYPLPLFPDHPDTIFREAFFTESPNKLADLLPADAAYAEYIRVIDVPVVTGGKLLTIIMSGEQDYGVGYLHTPGSTETTSDDKKD